MDEKQISALQEKVVELARETLLRGVLRGEMSPENPQHQIIVAGSMVVIAAATQGISIDEAINRAAGFTNPGTKNDGNDGHFGTYL